MTEQSIFEHLLSGSYYNQDNRDDINPLLIEEAAAIICDRFASEVNSAGKDRSYPPHYTRNVLELISKLCIHDDKHYQVNSANRSTVLSCLAEKYTDKNEDEMQDIIEQYVQELKMKKPLILDSIRQKFFKAQEEEDRKRELILESIRMKARELALSTGLEYNCQPPQKMVQYSRRYYSYKTFENKEEIENSKEKLKKKDNQYRLKHVSFGYAIMTLDHKRELSPHLSFLLKTLSRYETLHNYEKRFCVYLLKSIDKYPDLIDFFDDDLFFILEIQLIGVCKDWISGKETDFDKFLSEGLETNKIDFLITACKLAILIHTKIKNLLYTLYCFSNFNERILHFIKKLDIAVEC